MARSITEQIILELGVKGDKELEGALRRYAKSLQEVTKDSNDLLKVNKTAVNQLRKYQDRLKDLGSTWEKANVTQRDWERGLKGNEVHLDKATKALKEHIAFLEAQDAATKENIIRKEKDTKAEKARKKQVNELKFQLRHYGKTVKDVTAWEKLRKAAIAGNKKAMQMLNKEVNKAVVSNKKHTKTLLEQIFGVRNLRNEAEGASISFSVLRSKLLLLSFGFGMVSKTIGNFVKSAGDAEEITNKFNVVFGESAEEAERFAKSIGQRATSEIQNFLAVIQDTLVPLGFMRDFASDLSQVTVQLALDVASFNNKMDADVLRDFQSAMVGNHETVKKYGIILNQARVEMEAHRLGLVQADGTISEMGKTYGRLSLMVKGSTDAHGDLLKTQDEFNNQLKTFQATTKQTMESIGNVLKPLVTLLLMFANVALSPSAVFGYTTALAGLGARFLVTVGIVAKLRSAFLALNLVMFMNPATALISGIALLAGGLHALFTRSKDAKDGIENISEEFEKLTLEIAKYEAMTLESKIVVQKQKLAELNKELEKHNEKLTEQVIILNGRRNLLTKSNQLIEEEIEVLEKRSKVVETEIENLKELMRIRNWEKSQKFQEEVDKVAASYENQMFIAKQLTDEQKELAKASIKLGITMEELTNRPLTEQAVKLQKVINEWIKYKKGVEDAEEAKKAAERATKALAKAQAKELSDANRKAIKEFNDLKKSLKDLSKELEISAPRWADEAFARDLLIAKYLEEKMARKGVIDIQKDAIEAHIALLDASIQEHIAKGLSIDLIAKEIEMRNKLNDLITEGSNGGKEEHELLADKFDLYQETYGAISDMIMSHQAGIIQSQQQTASAEIRALEKTREYKRATTKEQKKMRDAITKDNQKAITDAFRLQQLAQVGQVWMNIGLAVARQFADMPFFAAMAAQPALLTIGGVQSAAIMAQKPPTAYAKGGDFITSGAENIVVGESGRERVTITPIDRPESRALGSMGGVTVNFSGNVLSQDFIEDEAIPMIKEAIRRGADIGVA